MRFSIISLLLFSMVWRLLLMFFNIVQKRKAKLYTDEFAHLAIESLTNSKHFPENYYNYCIRPYKYMPDHVFAYPFLYHKLMHKIFGKNLTFKRNMSLLWGILSALIFLIGSRHTSVFSTEASFIGMIFIMLSFGNIGYTLDWSMAYTERDFANFLIFSALACFIFFFKFKSYSVCFFINYFYVFDLVLIKIWNSISCDFFVF